MIGFGGAIHTDVSTVPMWIRFLERPRQTETIRALSKWPLVPGNVLSHNDRPLILTKPFTLDETVKPFIFYYILYVYLYIAELETKENRAPNQGMYRVLRVIKCI